MVEDGPASAEIVDYHFPYQRINDLVNRRRGITPSTALRLARFFGNSAAFWMNVQLRWDLYHAQLEEKAQLKRIKRLKLPPVDMPGHEATMPSSY